jgi:hypothetical protein
MLQVPICGCCGSGTQITRPDPGSPFIESPPQQSLFLRQRSPRTWQPDAGWQIVPPEVPKGAQNELQQRGEVLQPSHTSPSTLHEVVSVAQVPALAPAAMLQTPVQHSLSWRQMSPGCVQYEICDGAAHVIVVGLHLPLQQSRSIVQAFPAVWQALLSGAQAPLTHWVLQQLAPPALHG